MNSSSHGHDHAFGHSCDHEHGHDHHHHDHGHHHHAPKSFDRAFRLGIFLNISFVLIEFVYGYFAHSMALMADAGHNLSDVLALILAWGAAVAGKRKPSASMTYGLKSSTILASLLNSISLYAVLGIIFWESWSRLLHPQPVASVTMMIVAACGVFINGVTAYLFHAGKDDDLNIKGAYLHMMGDMLISLGVVLSGGLIYFSGWQWIDPVVSVVICGIIAWSTWGLLKDSMLYTLNAVPRHVDYASVKQFLLTQPGVTSMHDLHIWGMSTSETALTAHLVMTNGVPNDQFYFDLSAQLRERFHIHHVTIQVERQSQQGCVLEPDDVV